MWHFAIDTLSNPYYNYRSEIGKIVAFRYKTMKKSAVTQPRRSKNGCNAETGEARKEEAKVIKEPIEDLKTLEEYQQKYKKAPRGMTEETFDTESALKIYHTNFSTESIGHLESMMEMFRTKDGGVMPSYKGMALPKEVVESLGADKLNSL